MAKMTNRKKQSLKDLGFYIALLALPLLQFAIFYVVVNFNSFVLAFEKVTIEGGVRSEIFTFDNFVNVFRWIGGESPNWTGNPSDIITLPFWTLMWNSVKSWFICNAISIPLALLFSYYIFKKFFGSSFFRVMLFLPSIISTVVLCGIFIWFDSSFAAFMQNTFNVTIEGGGFLSDTKTQYMTVMFFYIWLNFGTTVLLFSNKMASISTEVLEAAKVDGANQWREFTSIVLPQTFSTLSVFLITGIAGLFVCQYNVFSFFGSRAIDSTSLSTFGYWFFSNVYDKANQMTPSAALFPLSAIGLVLTMIAVPLTLVIRHLLTKYGPSED